MQGIVTAHGIIGHPDLAAQLIGPEHRFPDAGVQMNAGNDHGINPARGEQGREGVIGKRAEELFVNDGLRVLGKQGWRRLMPRRAIFANPAAELPPVRHALIARAGYGGPDMHHRDVKRTAAGEERHRPPDNLARRRFQPRRRQIILLEIDQQKQRRHGRD